MKTAVSEKDLEKFQEKNETKMRKYREKKKSQHYVNWNIVPNSSINFKLVLPNVRVRIIFCLIALD